MRAIQNAIFIEFEPLCKKLWTFMSILPKPLTKYGQCHVTLASNFENFYFLPNSVLNFRKVTKFEGNWPKNKRYKQKTNWGMENTPLPVLIGLSLPM